MMKTYDVELEILTPVIINTGEAFEYCEIGPTGKIIDIKSYKPAFDLPQTYRFNQYKMDKIFDECSGQEIKKFIDESTSALLRGDNKALAKLRNERLAKCSKPSIRIPVRVLPLAQNDLVKKPMQKVDKVMQDEISSKTYIPGSSIKGAIRTAILEKLRADKGLYDKYAPKGNKRRAIEAEILFKETSFLVDKDPFKYLKVSDFSFEGSDGIQYIGKIDNGTTTPIYSAMTNSYALSGKPIIAKGTISIDDAFYRSMGLRDERKLLESIGNFYIDNIQTEKSNMAMCGSYAMKDNVLPRLQKLINADYALLRIGHYVGIQNCTLNVDQPYPPPKARKDINKTGGRAVLVEGGIIPGICMMRISGEK